MAETPAQRRVARCAMAVLGSDANGMYRRAQVALGAQAHGVYYAAYVGARVRRSNRGDAALDGAADGDRLRLLKDVVLRPDVRRRARCGALAHGSLRVMCKIIGRIGVSALAHEVSMNVLPEPPVQSKMNAAEDGAVLLAACVGSAMSPFAGRGAPHNIRCAFECRVKRALRMHQPS